MSGLSSAGACRDAWREKGFVAIIVILRRRPRQFLPAFLTVVGLSWLLGSIVHADSTRTPNRGRERRRGTITTSPISLQMTSISPEIHPIAPRRALDKT
jgi:hypothetical protein